MLHRRNLTTPGTVSKVKIAEQLKVGGKSSRAFVKEAQRPLATNQGEVLRAAREQIGQRSPLLKKNGELRSKGSRKETNQDCPGEKAMISSKFQNENLV